MKKVSDKKAAYRLSAGRVFLQELCARVSTLPLRANTFSTLRAAVVQDLHGGGETLGAHLAGNKVVGVAPDPRQSDVARSLAAHDVKPDRRVFQGLGFKV